MSVVGNCMLVRGCLYFVNWSKTELIFILWSLPVMVIIIGKIFNETSGLPLLEIGPTTNKYKMTR